MQSIVTVLVVLLAPLLFALVALYAVLKLAALMLQVFLAPARLLLLRR